MTGFIEQLIAEPGMLIVKPKHIIKDLRRRRKEKRGFELCTYDLDVFRDIMDNPFNAGKHWISKVDNHGKIRYSIHPFSERSARGLWQNLKGSYEFYDYDGNIVFGRDGEEVFLSV